MKKITALILAFLTCATLLSFGVLAAEDIEQTVDGFNRGRGEDEIIVYDPAFGSSTATNEWGSEAVVGADNKIISVTTRVGNAEIPEGGFVVSGHGAMDAWVKNNMKAGQYCYFDERGMTILVTDTPTQYGGIFFTVTRPVDSFNNTRYEDDLVIYTGSGTTKTNEWGYEAAVDKDGRIVSVGGNDTKIPTGGFVISGHGKNGEWLTKTAKVGMKASYDKNAKTLTLEMDEKAYIHGIDIGIQLLEDTRAAAIKEYLYCNYSDIDNCLKEMRALRASYEALTDVNEMADCIEKINALLNKGLSSCCESRTVEYRGVWIRPTQKTQAEVSAYVQRLYDAGINTLCIETLYSSTLIFPAPEGSDFEQNPIFKGFDVLKAYVEECHKRGMELHVWMPIFYSSHTTCNNLERSVWYKNPTWRNINNSGKDTCVKDDDDFCFLNPAHPEVQEFLLGTYQYILENYDIDGFELDYIRYQDGIEDDYGYDALTVGGFKEKYGVTPKFDTSASYWDNWVQYRCDIITGFVGKMRTLFNEYGEDVLLCADVGPDANGARNGIYQDYSKWIEKGWIDLLKPMSYTLDAVEATDKNVSKMNGKFLAAGIGVFADSYSGYDASTHVIVANQKGADGVMFFESNTYLGKETANHLLVFGAFRNRAMTPTFDTNAALTAVLDYSLGRVNEIIRPFGGMNASSCESYKQKVEALKGDIAETEDEELISIAKSIADSLGTSAAEKALKADLEYFTRILRNTERTVVKNEDIPDTGIDESDVSNFESSFEESSKAEESRIEESKKEESLKEESIRNEQISDTESETSVDIGDEKKPSPIIWVGIVVAGALLIASLAVIIRYKGKRK
ncbi:MAG: family 10 glycosylhydrolase [Clostridia bacterium]|nr:family 10 glycosylhydrolase [Clostridia bacterium]